MGISIIIADYNNIFVIARITLSYIYRIYWRNFMFNLGFQIRKI